MRKHLRPLILILILAMTLAACGDDDSFGGVDGDGNGGTDAPFGGDGGFGGDDTIPDVGDLGNIPGLPEGCSAILTLSSAMSSAFTGSFDGFDGSAIANLPGAIQGDGAIIADALQEFSDRLDAAGIDMSAGMQNLTQEQLMAFSDIGEAVFTDEVNDAFDRIGDYASEECTIGDEDF